MGSGLGHLLGLLEGDFRLRVGIDIALYAARETRQNARGALAMVASADQLDIFADHCFDAVVALHLVEHLAQPEQAIRHVNRILTDDGLFLFATPNPVYALRHFKHIERTPDAISKDPTHINVHPPSTWRRWVTDSGFTVLHQFGDGLWDVPYLPFIPAKVQFALLGWPSLIQVLSGLPVIPKSLGVNLITIARKERPR
jgi:SAM-dependent methyltransferase